MITNERQFKITNSQLKRLETAIKEFNLEEVTKRVGSEIIAKAEFNALESEINALKAQLDEYKELQSGAISILEAPSLEELPKILIRARIAQKLSQKELADLVGLKEQQIQRYESEDYVSASLHRLKQIADALKLTINESAEITLKRIIKRDEMEFLDWDKFPIDEMYKRGWFEEYSGSLDSSSANAKSLVRDYILSIFKSEPVMVLNRRSIRSNSQLNQYALLAWESRVLKLAMKNPPKNIYISKTINDTWISDLVSISSKVDGPRLAREMLKNIGIALVIEPHLRNTYLDGAALLNGTFPVIGMTLRHDRLDNFWFVLLHELFHVIKHLNKDKLVTIYDDLDATGKNQLECEADRLAQNALISEEKWETALPRYVQSEQSVKDFASELGISPAIVAGRIRNETNNYSILSDFVGQGCVRKLFPEATFGI
ncbi:MAG: helix-turn-helix domain-containing protein [Anaerolineaceae bacterium]|jgi:HTH-type transcriptional regulator/antitoxin HigA